MDTLPSEILGLILDFLPTADVENCLNLVTSWQEEIRRELNHRHFVKSRIFGRNVVSRSVEPFASDKQVSRLHFNLSLGERFDVLHEGFRLLVSPSFRNVHSFWIDLNPGLVFATAVFTQCEHESLLRLELPIFPAITTLILGVEPGADGNSRGKLKLKLQVGQRSLATKLLRAFPNVKKLHLEDDLVPVFRALMSEPCTKITNIRISTRTNLSPVACSIAFPVAPRWPSSLLITVFDIDVYRDWVAWQGRRLQLILGYMNLTLQQLAINRLPWGSPTFSGKLILPILPKLKKLKITHFSEKTNCLSDFKGLELLKFDGRSFDFDPDLVLSFRLYQFEGPFFDFDPAFTCLEELEFSSYSDNDNPTDVKVFGTLDLIRTFTSGKEGPISHTVTVFNTDIKMTLDLTCSCTPTTVEENFKQTRCQNCDELSRNGGLFSQLELNFPNVNQFRNYQQLQVFVQRHQLFYNIRNDLPKDYIHSPVEEKLQEWLFSKGNKFEAFCLGLLEKWGIPIPDPFFGWRCSYPGTALTGGHHSSENKSLRFWNMVNTNKEPITFLQGSIDMDLEPFLNYFVSNLSEDSAPPIVIRFAKNKITVQDLLGDETPVAVTSRNRVRISNCFINGPLIRESQNEDQETTEAKDMKPKGRRWWILSNKRYDQFLRTLLREDASGYRYLFGRRINFVEITEPFGLV